MTYRHDRVGFAGSIYAVAAAFYLFEIKAEPFAVGFLDVV